MYKYIASKRQREVIALAVVVAIICCAWIIWFFFTHPNEEEVTYFGMSIGLIGTFIFLFNAVWLFFVDPLLGKVSFDRYSVIFYLPFKTICFPFALCKEIAFTRWIGASAAYNPQYNYYIYLSKKSLTDYQRTNLLWKRTKKRREKPIYISEFVVFQYTPEVFAAFINCVPEPFRGQLIEEEKQLNLTPREKRLNS